MRNKIIGLILIAHKYKIIYITETHLSAKNEKEAEIAKSNFKLIREDRKNDTNFRRTSVYIRNTLKISKVN